MRTAQRILRTVDTISDWSGKIISYSVLILIPVIVYEVIARYAFNRPSQWAMEVSCFAFGILWILGGCYALLRKAHVSMELMYVHLTPRGKAIFDLATAPLFFSFIGVLLWKGLEMALYSISILEHSNTVWSPPVYPLRIIIPLGALLILLQGLAKFIRDLTTATTGKDTYL